jgi:hypothetical protein
LKRSLTGLLIAGVVISCGNVSYGQDLDAGRIEYLSCCAVCHGADAKGKGPLSGQLKTTPADLTTIAQRNNGVFPLDDVHQIIDGRKPIGAHGTREMPIWGYRYTPSPSQALSRFEYELRLLEFLRLLRPPSAKDRDVGPPPPSNPPYYLNFFYDTYYRSFFYDTEAVIRTRLLAIVDYLNRIQEK